jgi:hypothetical protein
MRSTGTPGNATGKKRKPDDGDIYTVDEFDETMPIDLEKDKCALCRQGHEFGLLLKRMLHNNVDKDTDDMKDQFCGEFMDFEGVWVSRYSFRRPKRTFAHYYCAVACPQVWFTGREWKGVWKEILRGQRLECSACRVNGATIGCFINSCGVKMHLHCALKNGFQMLRYNSNNFFCPKHLADKRKSDLAQNDLPLHKDIVQGREKVPIKFTNNTDDLLPFEDFTYITQNVDSEDFALNIRSVHGLDCCDCTGLCDDIEKCSCLSYGQNYTYSGKLIPYDGIDHKIVECNLKCSCSYR